MLTIRVSGEIASEITPSQYGSMPIEQVDVEAVLACLKPIWTTTPETASRVRNRIEIILSAAKAQGLRSAENPAAWRDNLKFKLAKRSKTEIEGHAALPFAECPSFMETLRQRRGTDALALQFTVLTAARTSEVLGITWGEVIKSATWTVPASRMKSGRTHRVPLEMKVEVTVHGFRSSFRDWAGDATSHPREVVEAALAHKVGDKAEQAYRRGDALEKRRLLMADWSDFLESNNQTNVTPFVASTVPTDVQPFVSTRVKQIAIPT